MNHSSKVAHQVTLRLKPDGNGMCRVRGSVATLAMQHRDIQSIPDQVRDDGFLPFKINVIRRRMTLYNDATRSRLLFLLRRRCGVKDIGRVSFHGNDQGIQFGDGFVQCE